MCYFLENNISFIHSLFTILNHIYSFCNRQEFIEKEEIVLNEKLSAHIII